MAGPAHPTDALVDDVIGVYTRGAGRLENIVRDGIRRGLDPDRVGTPEQRRGDATLLYRERARQAAHAELERLRNTAGQAGARVRHGYRAGIVATDRTTARTGRGTVTAGGRFGGIHFGAVDRLAANLEASLTRAAENARQNVDDVFARAAALDGPIPNASDVRRIGFVGRRSNDPWRRVALEELAAGQVSVETRRQITARLIDSLVNEGVADALTGFVDAGGRRWALDRYAEMVTRTTTREAVSAATVARLTENGLDLVTISSHDHQADECTPYDGGTFSLSGDSDRYDALDDLPPFHPNCEHVLTPGGVDDQDFEDELDRAITEALEGADAPAAPPPAAPPAPRPRPDVDVEDLDDFAPPLAGASRPTSDASTIGRLADARELNRLIDSDPGPDPDFIAARRAEHELEDAANAAAAKSPAELVDEALGPDVVAALEDLAKSGFREARDLDFRKAIVDGDLSLEDAFEYAEDYLVGLEGRRLDRQRLKQARGLKNRPIPCFICGQFKRMPADVCGNCGDDPISHNATNREIAEFNASHGYEPIGSREDPTDFGGRGTSLR